MICPSWVRVPRATDRGSRTSSPTSEQTLELPDGGRVFEIGGTDPGCPTPTSCSSTPNVRGLRRKLIYVPFLTPRLSSLWLALTTQLYTRASGAAS